jgi:hypothetical protein
VSDCSSVVRCAVQKVTSPEKKYCFGARDTLARRAKGVLKSGSGLAVPIGQGLENGKKQKNGKHWSSHNQAQAQAWCRSILSTKNNMDVFFSSTIQRR